MVEAKLNADGTITLFISKESVLLTAAELDVQIERLWHARSQMNVNDHGADVPPSIDTVVVNPNYFIRTDRVTKASLLSMRHSGFGWLHFELPSNEALNMRRIWNEIVHKLDLDASTAAYNGPERRTKLH